MQTCLRHTGVAILALWAADAAATEIHTCPLPDGTVMYSQLPCPDEDLIEDPEAPVRGDDGTPAERAETDTVALTVDEDAAADSQDVADCKKRYRDAIDAIDAELREDYRPELADDYKQRLLALTQKLREC